MVKRCDCHDEEMRWNKDARRRAGGWWYCAVKRRASRRRCYAAQLARGEQIQVYQDHHKGMAELKAQLGDPRPSGLTLSLIEPNSPSAYWGCVTKKGQQFPYRLSADPNDYVWETHAENHRRGYPIKELS